VPVLVWDKPEDRTYQNGLDKGVLYLPDGSAVVWNGLTEIVEKFGQDVEAVYFDGFKVNNLVKLGDFSASLKAVTYPDEFEQFEGMGGVRNGVSLTDQPFRTFCLCYRTMMGTQTKGSSAWYKIHIIYNLTAIPSDKNYTSLTDSPEIAEFEWDITAVPNEIPGFRQSAHMVLNSNELDPLLLQDIENMLYGTSGEDAASLIPMEDLVNYMKSWYRLKIINHGDGTWSAVEYVDGSNIHMLTVDLFEITGANAVYLSDVEFVISDTNDISEVPRIEIVVMPPPNVGLWQAITEQENIITIDEETGFFEIKDANVIFIDEYTYQISDTII